MPSTLLCYGTGGGQTRKVARRIAGLLEERGHAVTLVDADALSGDLDVSRHDAALVGACLDGASHQQSVRHFVGRNRAALSERPSGFFQVSMESGLADPQRRERAREFAEGFFETTGWHPDLLGLFGGALLYSRYGPIKRLLVRLSVGRATGDVDTSRDYEYTDWDEVEQFAGDFATFVGRRLGEPGDAGGREETDGEAQPGRVVVEEPRDDSLVGPHQ